MSKKAVSGTMLALLLTSMLSLAFNIQPVNPNPTTITIPDDYPTIQEAINHANEGDIIFVKNGTYHEHVVVNKTVSLVGENRDSTIVDGNGTGSVFYIVARNTTISGFTVQNADGGIYVSEWYSRVYGNIVTGIKTTGISLRDSYESNIAENIVTHNGNGLSFWYCHSNTVSGNNISENEFGIYIAYSMFFTLRNNDLRNNTFNFGVWSYGTSPYGTFYDFIHDIDTSNTINDKPIYYWVNRQNEQIPEDAGYVGIVNSTNVVVKNLDLTNNGQGVLFAFSTNSTVENASVSNTSNGIRIVSSNLITVKNNTLVENNHAIFDTLSKNDLIIGNQLLNNDNFGVAIANSNATTVKANLIQGNKCGIIIDGNPPFGGGKDNVIYHNNFINNTYQVYPYIAMPPNNTWDNGCEGNYWSDYNGTDTTSPSDGIGDTFLPWQDVDSYPLMNPYWNSADINHDLMVEGKDIAITAKAFGSYPTHPRWNPHADINQDGMIEGKDIATVAKNFGEKLGMMLFFEKSIYYPTQEAFWNQSCSLIPIRIIMIDQGVVWNSIIVDVSSSIDFKEVTLRKNSSGVFSGEILAKGLRLDESITNSSVFSVRYGDTITATYGERQTTALFLFPKWMGGEMGASERSMFKAFDSDGVLLVNYGSYGLQYNPVFIGIYALDNYQEYLNTANASFRDKFLIQANWFVRNARLKGNFSVWEYTFDWPWNVYNVTVPYVSALAQGNGLSVLVRAYIMTGNATYLEVAETAMKSFEFEMNEGGVRYTDSGGVWYEELADEGARSGKVLNGFMGALMRLYEFSFGANNTEAFALFEEGTDTLAANLYRYDTGSGSYYDLLTHSPASLDYHKAHIGQLRIMYELTGINTFLEYSNRFQSYLP